MQIIKKIIVVAGLIIFVTVPCSGTVVNKSSCVSMPKDETEVMFSEKMGEMVSQVEACKGMCEMVECKEQPMVEPMPEPMMHEDVSMMPKSEQMDLMMADSMDSMPSNETQMMMSEDMRKLLQSLVLLIDIDFHKRMIVVDVDFYRDDARMIDSLLVNYAHNPEQAEELLYKVAECYMDEHGDEVILSLLKNFKIADAELLTHIVRPFVQKALMTEFLNAMHRCIMHKSMKLNEIMVR